MITNILYFKWYGIIVVKDRNILQYFIESNCSSWKDINILLVSDPNEKVFVSPAFQTWALKPDIQARLCGQFQDTDTNGSTQFKGQRSNCKCCTREDWFTQKVLLHSKLHRALQFSVRIRPIVLYVCMSSSLFEERFRVWTLLANNLTSRSI